MLKEQLFGLAIKTLTQAYETKERIKNNFSTDVVANYVRSAKETALGILEYQVQKILKRGHDAYFMNGASAKVSSNQKGMQKKPRKSSIKPAKEIGSKNADIVLAKLKEEDARLVNKSEAINGKTSLAYLVWALGHAERANIAEGISVHDVSALLYRACNIELYPINISRVVYGNQELVKQVGQQKRTKTYLLTADGLRLFKKNFA
jgi:hypothetical protein